jgi:lipopolysaccharide export system protein LptC
MPNIKQSFLIFFSVSIIIWIISYFSHLGQKQFHSIDARTFDTKINNIYWIEFDESGVISHEFYSPEVTSSTNNNAYKIKKPHLKVTQNNENWEIVSKYAHTSNQTEKIKLIKDVKIHHSSPNNPNISKMTTDHLVYLPKTKIAKTSDWVKITLGESVLYSKGLEADFEQNKKIKLNAVYGQYATNSKNSILPTS